MSQIPYLERLGDELRRATRDEPARRGKPIWQLAGGAVAAAAVAAGLVAVFLLWDQGPELEDTSSTVVTSIETPTSIPPDVTIGVSDYGAADLAKAVIVPPEVVNDPQHATKTPAEVVVVLPEIELLTASYVSAVSDLVGLDTSRQALGDSGDGGPYPLHVLNAVGQGFNVVYVPTYLPEGYELFGPVRPGGGFTQAPRIQVRVLRKEDLSLFILDQYAEGHIPRWIQDRGDDGWVWRDVGGVRLFTWPTVSDYFTYFFEVNGIWFDIVGSRQQNSGAVDENEVAKIAASLAPHMAGLGGWTQPIVPVVPVYGTASIGEGPDAMTTITSELGRIIIVEVPDKENLEAAAGMLTLPSRGEGGSADPVYVPTYLPAGYSLADAEILFGRASSQRFEGPVGWLWIDQDVAGFTSSVIRGFAEPITVDGHSGVSIRGAWAGQFGGTMDWDPDAMARFVLEIGNGIISIRATGIFQGSGVGFDEMVKIVESLLPVDGWFEAQLAEGLFPQRLLDQLGPGFGTLMVPSYLPEGWQMEGKLGIGSAATPGGAPSILRYREGASYSCSFVLSQHPLVSDSGRLLRPYEGGEETSIFYTDDFGQTQRGTSQVVKATISGIDVYSIEYDYEPDFVPGVHTFLIDGVWFEINNPYSRQNEEQCALSSEEIARIGNSLTPLEHLPPDVSDPAPE